MNKGILLILIAINLPMAFFCANLPKIEKQKLMEALDKSESDELMEYYKKNYWRKYQITGHTDFDFSGEDIYQMFQAAKRCRTYYRKISEKLTDEQGNIKPVLNNYSIAQLSGLREKLVANAKVVCSSLKKDDALVKEGASVFFYKFIQADLFSEEKKGIAALDQLIADKEKEEEIRKKIQEAGG